MSSPAAPSSAPPPPQPSALPPSHQAPSSHSSDNLPSSSQPSSDSSKVIPQRKALLRLELRDLSSAGSRAFLRLVHASIALQDAVDNVLKFLYKDMHVSCIPPTRSVTFVIRDMEGVAYTTGLDLDQDHKEIHLNTKYIEFVPESRQKEEILGVMLHEMVHCWQHSAFGTAPQGLIEGIADWVRLKAGFAPPHWKRHIDCDWDAGYERTGYFLEWLEEEHCVDIVRKINEAMRECEYDEDKFWHGCCKTGIKELWADYKKSVGDGDEKKSVDDGDGKESAGDGDEKEDVGDGVEKESKDATEEDVKSTGSGTPAQEQDRPAPNEDDRTLHEKARRGGNMHVPVRPGTSS